MRAHELIPLHEVNMSPTGLKKASDSIEALIGIEFEMAVPSNSTVEPDYDMDESAVDFRDIDKFFRNGDGIGSYELRRLQNKLTERYDEFVTEKFNEEWAFVKKDYIRNYMDRTVWQLEVDDRVMQALEYYGYDTDVKHDTADYKEALTKAEDDFEQVILTAIKNGGDDDYGYDAREEYRNNEWKLPDELDFLRETTPAMSDVADVYDVTWPYLTSSHENFWEETAQEFQRMIGKTTVVSPAYHMVRRGKDQYIMEPDSSIEGPNGEDLDRSPHWKGVEFVSPPQSLPKMLDDLSKIKKWSGEYGCETNESTGLHINVSIPSRMAGDLENFDYIKLVLFLGDEWILKQFERDANSYCASSFKKLKDSVGQYQDTTIMGPILNNIRSGLNMQASRLLASIETPKYSSINVHTIGNYIEFRSPGGNWLETDLKQLENTVRRFVVALNVACDDTKFKKEYGKKLYKLLTKSTESKDQLDLFVRYASKQISKEELFQSLQWKKIMRGTPTTVTSSPSERETEIYDLVLQAAYRGIQVNRQLIRNAKLFIESNPSEPRWQAFFQDFQSLVQNVNTPQAMVVPVQTARERGIQELRNDLDRLNRQLTMATLDRDVLPPGSTEYDIANQRVIHYRRRIESIRSELDYAA